jgi:endonuclease-8
MPEGPSIVIMKEEFMQFKGKKVLSISGNAKIDLQRAKGKKIEDLKSWGKHFLICFDDFFFRIHLLMWGSYRINEEKDAKPRLSIKMRGNEFNFYSCAIKLIEGKPEDVYDWEVDVMSDEWNAKTVEKGVKAMKHANVCDALMNQELFSGLGNIIKNEVLFRIKVHPKSFTDKLPPKKLKEMIKEARIYSLQFYEWKKKYELKKHWLIYKKGICPRCNIKTKREWLGKTNRMTCFCDNCQVVYK